MARRSPAPAHDATQIRCMHGLHHLTFALLRAALRAARMLQHKLAGGRLRGVCRVRMRARGRKHAHGARHARALRRLRVSTCATVMRGRGAVKITWVAEAAALVPFQAEGNLYTGPALARRRCMASGKRTSVMHRSANPLSHALQLSDRRQCAFLHTRNGPHARRAESMQRAPCPTDLQESTRR